jgi:streptogramin lyase
VFAITVIVVAAGCTSQTVEQPDPASASPTFGQPSAARAKATDFEKAGARPISVNGDWLAAGGGGVWLSGSTSIHRLDPRSGKPVAEVPVPEGPCEASVVGFGALWTATCTKRGLARVDPDTNKVSKHVALRVAGDGEGSIGAGAGAVWIVLDAEGGGCGACRLAKVDPATLRVTHLVRVAAGAAGVRYGVGSVWVTNPLENVLEQVDPAKGRVVRSIKVGPQPRFMAVGEGAVWTLNQGDGSVTRVDPTSGATTTVSTDFVGEGGDATAGGGWVWLRGSSVLLARLDPGDGHVVEQYGPDAGSGAVIVGFGAVWVSAHDIDTVWRFPMPSS